MAVALVIKLAIGATVTVAAVGSRAAAGTAGSGDHPAVVGGSPTALGEWPDAVAVLGAHGSCTGTLIAPDAVLTAGHCAEIAPQRIVAGTTDYTRGGTAVEVAATIAYPDFGASYDVAVLQLATPLPGVIPRALAAPCTFDRVALGTAVELVGFGLTDDAARGTNTTQHEAAVAITDPTCATADGCRAAIAPGGELAAGGDGVDSCSGDSGGPVYLETEHGAVAIGVVSRGVGGAATPCGDGGIYVRVDKVAGWIADVAGGATLDQCKAALDAGGSDDPITASDDAMHDGCSTTRGDSSLLLGALVVLSGVVRRRCPSTGHARPSFGHDDR